MLIFNLRVPGVLFCVFLLFKKIVFNVYLFLRERVRERERESVGEGQRGRQTQNLKQDPGSKLSAQSLTQGSNP